MAERRIGQEAFQFATKAAGQTSLVALASLIDWAQVDFALAGLYPSAKGEKAWPPLGDVSAIRQDLTKPRKPSSDPR